MRPTFKAEYFKATEFDSAEQKAKFANYFVRFVESGFKSTIFAKWFYTRLSSTFGHIAHYSRDGFYSHYFTTTADKHAFLRDCLQGGGYGDPRFTYSDVEIELKSSGYLQHKMRELHVQIGMEQETAERAELARLKRKYEPKA